MPLTITCLTRTKEQRNLHHFLELMMHSVLQKPGSMRTLESETHFMTRTALIGSSSIKACQLHSELYINKSDLRASESLTQLKLTAEKMIQEQASVKTDLQITFSKLEKAEQEVRSLETRLQDTKNENAILRVKQQEALKLWEGSAFDESDIIREMSDLINDGKGVLSSTGSKMLPVACNVPTDGDYIELDDINASLDGFALRPPVHGGVLGRSEEQQLWFMADANAETQALPHSQGLAAHRAWLPTPASRGRPKAVHTALPQAENSIRGGDVSIPISREHCKNSGTHVSGSYSGDRTHVVESSTRSYLSKHMSTYTVSKYEMLPTQLCYASSFADGQNCIAAVDDQLATPPVAFSTKGKCNLNADILRKLPTTPIKLPSSSSVLTKSSEDVAADTSEKRHSSPIYSPLPSSTPSKSSSRSRNVEGPSATQACGKKLSMPT